MPNFRTLCAILFGVVAAVHGQDGPSQPSPICVQINEALSSASDVFYPGQPQYENGISHWASSSTQRAKCVVEPGTTADVGVILKIVGSTNSSFAVKGGGHATNPNFSSTTGIHISMTRFSEVIYNDTSQTVVIGAGLIWDDVYAALEPHNVNVVGGRVSGVGVAGFILGGGYSWKTNQYGLTVDTVVAFELVKPDGTVTTVNETSNPDLFFALKGGFNNFGIVTRFSLRTFPQTEVWGGTVIVTEPFLEAVSAATADFAANVKDPKAQIITNYNFFNGQLIAVVILFYDGPIQPVGIFEQFTSIPLSVQDVNTRSFLSLVKASPSNITYGTRGLFQAVNILEYTPAILEVMLNETKFWGGHLTLETAALVSYAVEPFLPSIFSHNSAETAYPPVRSLVLCPSNMYFAWVAPEVDSDFYDAARQSAATISAAAVAEGQTALVQSHVYPNYALYDTPLENMYGRNIIKLKKIKRAVDPQNVMGLAGGWKF